MTEHNVAVSPVLVATMITMMWSACGGDASTSPSDAGPPPDAQYADTSGELDASQAELPQCAPQAGIWAWSTAAPMPTARQNGASAASPTSIYVAGGLNDAGYLDVVERYDPESNSWSPVASLSTPRCCAAAAWANGRLYIAGGLNDSGLLATVESYDPISDQWRPEPSLPQARKALAATVVAEKILVIGGSTSTPQAASDRVDVFDPGTQTWSTPWAPLLLGRTSPAAVTVPGGAVVVAGGFPDAPEQEALYGTAAAEGYVAGGWTALGALGTPRGQTGAASVDGCAIVAGGYGPSGHSDAVEALAVPELSWVSLPPLPTPRAGVTVTSLGDALYVIGGWQYQGAANPATFSTVEVLRHSP